MYIWIINWQKIKSGFPEFSIIVLKIILYYIIYSTTNVYALKILLKTSH